MGTIIKLLTTYNELEEIYLYANTISQRCPKEIMKIFMHLEQRISPQIFEKIRNGPSGIIRGLGETDPCRKPEVKNLVALSF
jgi:hypothetical protein